MKSKQLSFSELSLEARTEAIKEAAEESAWAIEKTEEKIARLAELLKQQKAALGHGKWLPWVRETFGDTDAAVWKVQRWLRAGRSNNAPAHYLELGEQEDKDDKPTPRAARIPDRVEVVESASVPDGHSGDANKMVDTQPDPDPTPGPPTIRKAAKGSDKASEDKKPRTQTVVPEVLADAVVDPVDDWMSQATIDQILARWVALVDVDGSPKQTAKQLRKLADKLDPPTKFVRPDLEEVSAYFAELKASGPESFFDFYESKGWLVGKVSMKDWRASARKWVRENESNPFGGTDNGNGKRTAANADPESCLGPNGRPKIERAKIVYK